jgi:tRNA pseudouridine32 synthase / 23S rRNA pseudouridine746 synthase
MTDSSPRAGLAGLARSAAYAPPRDEGLEIVYQDAHLIAINKPPNLLSVPGRGDALQDCALHRVQQRFPQALLVHRLDEATSGLLLFALSHAAQKAASGAFETRQVKKAYVARVHGLVLASEGWIDAPIAKDWPRRPLHRVDWAQGKAARTFFRLLSKDELLAQSLLGLEPETGRTHQLRVHMQSIGHAIVGDRLYGPPDDTTPRLMLHATRLQLPHPLRPAELLCIDSPAPFAGAWQGFS